MATNNLTLVTGLFDLGRGEMDTSFSRPFDQYKECFSKLLQVRHLPMIIFCESNLAEFIWQYRDRANTRLIIKTLDDIRKFPFYDEVQKIRTNPEWYGQAGWLEESTQARLELYNPLVMSKQFFLNDASIHDPFDTNYFLWVDAGLANTVQVNHYFDETFEKRITKHLDKMLYICFPYDGQVEVHGFQKAKLNELSGTADTEWVARGGMFGGPKWLINEMNATYYALLHDTLKAGYMGTEESIFTIMSYTHANKINRKMIDMNGLVYKFFEDLRNEPYDESIGEPLALYCLTYNLPEQFEFWAKSLKSYLGKNYDDHKKYVINNSDHDDSDADALYDALFKEYNFEEIKLNNVGINGGRYHAAEHFHKSTHEYMIFFEDDMLMCDKTFAGKLCKSGFNRWIPNMFEDLIGIMRFEQLDSLKLSFSEFYGDGHVNWAHTNTPPVDKERLFPDRVDGVDKHKTKIDYTGTFKKIPYAIGEYHYCNWPILFNKAGNKKMFIDEVWVYKYEQTWMSYAFRDLMRVGKFKTGVLLASPINHERKYFYKNRKENEHG